MNQILVTEKLYVTPELKRKKRIYKIELLLSVFLICLLFSYYIYAEYDRNKSEEVSKEILAEIKEQVDTTVKKMKMIKLLLFLRYQELKKITRIKQKTKIIIKRKPITLKLIPKHIHQKMG